MEILSPTSPESDNDTPAHVANPGEGVRTSDTVAPLPHLEPDHLADLRASGLPQ